MWLASIYDNSDRLLETAPWARTRKESAPGAGSRPPWSSSDTAHLSRRSRPVNQRGRRCAVAVWQQIIRQYDESGLSQEAFAAKRGIPVSTLRFWIYRFRREGEDAPQFLPVRVVGSPAPQARVEGEGGAAIEAVLPDGLRLRFGAGTGSAVVVEVLGQLRRC